MPPRTDATRDRQPGARAAPLRPVAGDQRRRHAPAHRHGVVVHDPPLPGEHAAADDRRRLHHAPALRSHDGHGGLPGDALGRRHSARDPDLRSRGHEAHDRTASRKRWPPTRSTASTTTATSCGHGGLAADITEFVAGDDPVEIAKIGDVTVKAFEVEHLPVKPAYGFRFESGGRVITISGDTNPCPGLLNGSKDADIMVCDSMNVNMMKGLEDRLRGIGNAVQASLLEDAHSYHAPIAGMAELAEKAGVKHLVLSHVIPPVDGRHGAAVHRRAWTRCSAAS